MKQYYVLSVCNYSEEFICGIFEDVHIPKVTVEKLTGENWEHAEWMKENEERLVWFDHNGEPQFLFILGSYNVNELRFPNWF